jgi:HEAT repeat protein
MSSLKKVVGRLKNTAMSLMLAATCSLPFSVSSYEIMTASTSKEDVDKLTHSRYSKESLECILKRFRNEPICELSKSVTFLEDLLEKVSETDVNGGLQYRNRIDNVYIFAPHDMNLRIDYNSECKYPVTDGLWNWIKDADINGDESVTLPELLKFASGGKPDTNELAITEWTDTLINNTNRSEQINAARNLISNSSLDSMFGFVYAWHYLDANKSKIAPEIISETRTLFDDKNIPIFLDAISKYWCGWHKEKSFLDIGEANKDNFYPFLIKNISGEESKNAWRKNLLMGSERDSEYDFNLLARIGNPESIPYALKYLYSEYMNDRSLAVKLLSSIKSPDTAKILIKAINDSNWKGVSHPKELHYTLSAIGGEAVTAEYLNLLTNRTPNIRIFIEDAIDYLGDVRSREAMAPIINKSKSPMLTRHVIEALAKIDPKKSSKNMTLGEMLNTYSSSLDDNVRNAALSTSEYIDRNNVQYRDAKILLKTNIQCVLIDNSVDIQGTILSGLLKGRVEGIPEGITNRISFFLRTDKDYAQSYQYVTNRQEFSLRGLWGGRGEAILDLENPDGIVVYQLTIPYKIDYKLDQINMGPTASKFVISR